MQKASLSSVVGQCQGVRRLRGWHWTPVLIPSVQCEKFRMHVGSSFLRIRNVSFEHAGEGAVVTKRPGGQDQVRRQDNFQKGPEWLWLGWHTRLTPAGELPDWRCEERPLLVPKRAKILPGHLQLCPRATPHTNSLHAAATSTQRPGCSGGLCA